MLVSGRGSKTESVSGSRRFAQTRIKAKTCLQSPEVHSGVSLCCCRGRCARILGMSEKTMLITGVSSGLGKALAEEGLHQGWRVVGTLRKEADRRNFEATNPDHAIGRILD